MLKGLSYSAQAYHRALMVKSKRLARPRDPNQLAKLIADIATGEKSDSPVTDDGRDIATMGIGPLMVGSSAWEHYVISFG